MNTQRTIEQQETELKELLQRVMQAPLEPISNSVQKLDKHLGVLKDLEEQIKDLRDVDLAALTLTTNESYKCTRSIKSLAEEIPTHVENNIKILLTQELGELQKVQLSTLERVKIHLEEQTEVLRNIDLAALKQTTDESYKCTRSINSIVENIPAEVMNKLQSFLAQELGGLQKVHQSALEIVKTDLKEHINATQHRANENEIKLRTLIETQKEQILLLLIQNGKGAIQFKSELAQIHAGIKRWLIANVLFAGAGLIGMATLVTRLYS